MLTIVIVRLLDCLIFSGIKKLEEVTRIGIPKLLTHVKYYCIQKK